MSGAHAYARHGNYTATVAIRDDGGPAQTATSAIMVRDAGIIANRTFLRETAGRTFTAAVASFQDRIPLRRAASFTAQIDWEDGSTSAATLLANGKGGFDVVGTHKYAQPGSYSVQVRIIDGDVTTLVTSGVKVDDVTIALRGLTAIAVATQVPRSR